LLVDRDLEVLVRRADFGMAWSLGEYVATRRDFSEQTAREVDCAVRDLVTEAFEPAVGVLEAHRDALAESAERLLEKETLSGDELPMLSPRKPEKIR
jgi:ATP-dependent Zn protease